MRGMRLSLTYTYPRAILSIIEFQHPLLLISHSIRLKTTNNVGYREREEKGGGEGPEGLRMEWKKGEEKG